MTLTVGMIAIGWALKVDLHPERGNRLISWDCWPEFRYKLWLASGMVCDVVIAYSTMLTAVVVFYYSVTENKRLGVPYRRLIAYTVGPLTIPILFMFTLFLTVFMVVSQHVPWKHTMYVCAIYILLLQTGMILLILGSTSYNYGKLVICRVEKNNYRKEIYSEINDSIIWGHYAGHLEKALRSEEITEDKKELLQEFLRIPFMKKAGGLSSKYFCRKEFNGEELEKIYLFYFSNISSAFQNLDGREKEIERNELYSCIGSFVKELEDCFKPDSHLKWKDEKNEGEAIYHMVLSGIMNGMVYSDVEDKYRFCDYIFSECITNKELSVRQLHLYVLFQEVLHIFIKKPEKGSSRIRKLAEWETLETDNDSISFCADFWDIWVKLFHVSQAKRLEHFEMAMETMTGCNNKSQAVFEILLQTKAERIM